MEDIRNNANRGEHKYPRQQKEKKSYVVITISIVMLVIIIGGVWIWYGNRGAWVCKNGEWVMQGKTNKEKPTEICKEQVTSQERQKPSEDMIKLDSEKVAEGIDIRVKTPHVNATLSSPIEIVGEAKNWYKDESFVVHLIDKDGAILGEGTAKAQKEINTDEYIPFEAKIKFDQGEINGGDLIFYRNSTKDELGDAGTFSFPVFFE